MVQFDEGKKISGPNFLAKNARGPNLFGPQVPNQGPAPEVHVDPSLVKLLMKKKL